MAAGIDKPNAIEEIAEDISGKKIEDLLRKVYIDYRGNDAERLVVLTDDNQMVVFGSRDPNRVSVPLGDIIRSLGRRGKTLENVTAMIHNHNRGNDFSPEDMDIYSKLSSIGFKGAYQMYDPDKRRLRTAKLKIKQK